LVVKYSLPYLCGVNNDKVKQQKTTKMNNLKVNRTMKGIYSITLLDYDLTFEVENLNQYGIAGGNNWEAVSRDDRAENFCPVYFDTLKDAKSFFKYIFCPAEFGITL